MDVGQHCVRITFRTNGIIITLLQNVIINLMTYYSPCWYVYNPSVGTEFSQFLQTLAKSDI